MTVAIVLFLLTALLAVTGWVTVTRRALARTLLAPTPRQASGTAVAPLPTQTGRAGRRTFPPRYRWMPAAVGGVTFAALWLATPVPPLLAGSFAVLVAAGAQIGEETWASFSATRIETQLSETIDLLVSSLRAGAAVVVGFETALRDLTPPLRPHFEEVVGRIRLGDDPRDSILEMADVVPLETFRLFAIALAVHWDVGGGLASTLATVGRTIRDRIELERRIRTQGIEAHASVVAVMGITYLLAFLMWRADGPRFLAFFATSLGATLAAVAVALQAVGLIWMSRLSRSRF